MLFGIQVILESFRSLLEFKLTHTPYPNNKNKMKFLGHKINLGVFL